MGLTIALTTVELWDCLRYFLTNEEKHAGVMWAAIMAYQYLSGARISEVLALKRRQICAENGTLHPYFKRTKLKTGKSRSEHTVRIDPACEVAQVVQRWMEESRRRYARLSVDEWAFACGFRDKPVRRDNAWKAYQRAYKFLGIDYVSRGTHAIRKTAGEVQYDINRQASGDGFRAVQQVQNFYSHATSANTEKYLRIKPGAETEIARQHGECVRIKTSTADVQNDLADN